VTTEPFLSGANARARWMRMDAAGLLKRLFFCEQALILAQAGWLGHIAPLDVKLALPYHFWQDALTAHALRERVLELRFPSRLLEVGADAPLVQIFAGAVHAPGPEAFVMALARVLKPALLDAYTDYLGQTDEVADGPSRRFLHSAIQDRIEQIPALIRFSEEMVAGAPERRPEAEKWCAILQERLAALKGTSLLGPLPAGAEMAPLPDRRPFALAEIPARDDRFFRCRFYWPDVVDPDFPYGEGLRLQLRSAISHLNEVWAVESAGAALYTFGELLGWEFVLDAARWTYDESRHVRMGYERLRQWGFEPHEMPLGTYIYDSGRGQDPLYRLAMLFYFETKNIGKKLDRAETFARYGDDVSRHDMEFDWADETIHAHYGRHWLQILHQKRPDRCPVPDQLRPRCEELVADVVASAGEAERREIRRVAEAMIAKAEGRPQALI
jgi:hypothetical protein